MSKQEFDPRSVFPDVDRLISEAEAGGNEFRDVMVAKLPETKRFILYGVDETGGNVRLLAVRPVSRLRRSVNRSLFVVRRGPFDFWDALWHPWGLIRCAACWGLDDLPDSYKDCWVKVFRWGGLVRAMRRHGRVHDRLAARKVPAL